MRAAKILYALIGCCRIAGAAVDQDWPSWAHPVVCGGNLFIRNQGVLTCYDIKAG